MRACLLWWNSVQKQLELEREHTQHGAIPCLHGELSDLGMLICTCKVFRDKHPGATPGVL